MSLLIHTWCDEMDFILYFSCSENLDTFSTACVSYTVLCVSCIFNIIDTFSAACVSYTVLCVSCIFNRIDTFSAACVSYTV